MRSAGLVGIHGVIALGIALGACGDFDPRDENAQAGAPAIPSEDDDDEGTGGETSISAGGDGSTGDPFDDDARFDVGTDDEDPGIACSTAEDVDDDSDGFTEAAGDCNDCDPNVNPSAIDVIVSEPGDDGKIPEPADENCDGLVDNAPDPCDGGMALADGDPTNAARAMGLCKTWSEDSPWGLKKAEYVRADGSVTPSSEQNGIFWGFGDNIDAQEGSQLLALSTGRSRTPGQLDACGSMTCEMSGAGNAPPGFPQDVPECPGDGDIFDDIALEVTLVAPSNATGFAFNFDFFSFEYPEWVCTPYNDQFIALVSPPPEGSINGNISFDAQTNPVSVNIAYFEVCDGCPLGSTELQGTGFGAWNNAGATSWLETTSPIEGGAEFTIRFLIWDTGDQRYDSTVLLDNFRWIADGGTVAVGTAPVG